MKVEKFFNETTGKENLRQKFDYIHNHFYYDVMNRWNNLQSLANNVKIYNLGLCEQSKAYELLGCNDFYENINIWIEEFEEENNNYRVYFNGRSGGYLVLTNKDNNYNVIDEDLLDFSSYEELVQHYKESNYTHKDALQEARNVIEHDFDLVVKFDDLCDKIRQEVIYMIENAEVETYTYFTEHKAQRIVYK